MSYNINHSDEIFEMAECYQGDRDAWEQLWSQNARRNTDMKNLQYRSYRLDDDGIASEIKEHRSGTRAIERAEELSKTETKRAGVYDIIGGGGSTYRDGKVDHTWNG